jgi:dUTP pyrophosphatase
MVFFKALRIGAQLPMYESPGAAGADIRACLQDKIMTIEPLGRAVIPTGLAVEIPIGMEIQVRPRSGIAINFGVTVLNSPGTIDSDYRGEIGVMLINLGEKNFIIRDGDRIAQIVLAANRPEDEFEWSTELSETDRGVDGFGSTGVK